MRLLNSLPSKSLEITKNLDDDELPQYAILSHTWGPDEEEVSYQDFTNGTGIHKSGYGKLVFCGEQARRDGQDHFWVDTCCIDKSNSVELNTAITSMFHWYARAKKCYVYLADVSIVPSQADGEDNAVWQSFRSCRWLTRGWTLQELLAPEVVEFYDKSGQKLGDKKTLERHICDVTGIPAAALRGRPLTSFSMEERISWQRSRKTRKPEDEAYSLSGICGVSVMPIYGEGRDRAMARLRREVDDVLQGPKRREFSIPFGDTAMEGVENFVAREKELEEMHSALNGDGSRRTVNLYGLGGIGKTQLAIAYARRHKDSYSAIFWLDIRDEASVKQSFGTIAKRVLQYHPSTRHLSDIDMTGNLNDVVEGVKAWLGESDNTRWLAIYDNYDNPRVPGNNDAAAIDIRRFLPTAYQGTNIEPDPDVIALVQKLDGLPLALATTGSYLDQVTVSVAEYLTLYTSSWLQLHENDPGLDTYEDRTLYSTWRVSLDRIQQQNEVSAKLLGLWCYFSNQDLWFELIRGGPMEHLPWLRSLTASLSVFTEAMRLLCHYGLVEGDTVSNDTLESRGYSIHACVHSWTIHVLNKQWDDKLAKFAVCAVGQHSYRPDTTETWAIQRRLLQHAERCSSLLSGMDTAQAGLEESLHNLGVIYYFQGKMKKAEKMCLLALSIKEEVLGPKHASTLHTVSGLGILYYTYGKAKESEEMYLRALSGREEVLGPKHVLTLETVNNLGALYFTQGKMKEANRMYLRALSGEGAILDPKHTLTFDALNNLGNLYYTQGKMKEAEDMYVRALSGKEKVWGQKHTSTLDIVNNLGNLYYAQGKLQDAEEMYFRALSKKEETWGPKHIWTLDTVNNLGALYYAQGKAKEAEEMYLRALSGREEALGLKHRLTLDTVNNLGVLYFTQDRAKEAEEMYLRALHGKEKTLGPEHPSTLDSLNNLAMLYGIQGKMEVAGEMSLRVLRAREELLGTKHASTLDTYNNLGNLYESQGKAREAEEMYLRALGGKEEALGRKHTSTLDTVNNLAILYQKQGRLEDAEEMYLRALSGMKEALGPKHTSTVDVVNNLANLYSTRGKKKEAGDMFLQALSRYEEALGPKHTSTLSTVSNLASHYHEQGMIEVAEKMYLRALSGREEVLGLNHTSTLDTAYNLGNFYQRQGNRAEAERMFLRALEGYQLVEGDYEADIRYLRAQLSSLQISNVTVDTSHLALQNIESDHPSDPLHVSQHDPAAVVALRHEGHGSIHKERRRDRFLRMMGKDKATSSLLESHEMKSSFLGPIGVSAEHSRSISRTRSIKGRRSHGSKSSVLKAADLLEVVEVFKTRCNGCEMYVTAERISGTTILLDRHSSTISAIAYKAHE
nr:vegetative incompatibility protein het-e-1 [Quercus suber]